ncbi:MAG: hypothetical protein JWM96_1372 [Alphaproteobacteria bacterium]|nr:hypothetical protein [Alphaproteobacteria bacterium]
MTLFGVDQLCVYQILYKPTPASERRMLSEFRVCQVAVLRFAHVTPEAKRGHIETGTSR